MKKSIMKRYFLTCASIIIVSILILGSMLLMFASYYYKNDRKNLLFQNVEYCVEAAQEEYREISTVTLKNMSYVFNVVSKSLNASVFLVDTDGQTLFCSDELNNDLSVCVHKVYTINKNLLEDTANKGSYFSTGTFNGMYDMPYYTYGMPITVPGENGNTPIAFIFASLNVDTPLHGFLNEIFKMFIVSAIIVILISFILIYYISLQIVKPLRMMADAAKRFGNGDFSVRVPVESDDEIGQLTKEMNNMAYSLSVIDSTHRSFVANVSHELKTPMTTISGFIDGILDGTIPQSQQKYYLKLVSDEVKRLSRLVKTMLNLSKIEAGEMTINKTDIDLLDTVIQILITFEPTITSKNIEILGLDEDPVIVNADPDLIHQVVYNLVENAVKFTNENGYIQFKFETKQNMVYVSIKNSGMGLTKEELKKVFDRFYKSDRSRGLDKNGVGLGLYIVKSIVTAHGGDIQVSSSEGEYCEFTFSVAAAGVNKSANKRNNIKN